jgi:hypothetical protein
VAAVTAEDGTRPAWAGGDVVVACADLAGRAGVTEFTIGCIRDDVPAAEAGWYASVSYRGTRLIAQDHRSPEGAALALAQRILSGGACRCGATVALADGQPGCRWRLAGQRWEPGCDAPPIRLGAGLRGDLHGMQTAMNREQRRRQARR